MNYPLMDYQVNMAGSVARIWDTYLYLHTDTAHMGYSSLRPTRLGNGGSSGSRQSQEKGRKEVHMAV